MSLTYARNQSPAVGSDFNVLMQNLNNSREIYLLNSVLIKEIYREQIKDEFNDLKNKWLTDTMFSSNIDEIVNHYAYKEIVKFGPVVIPLIIEDLKQRPNLWFHSLASITGINPIQEGHEGNLPEMANDWIDWAESNNLV